MLAQVDFSLDPSDENSEYQNRKQTQKNIKKKKKKKKIFFLFLFGDAIPFWHPKSSPGHPKGKIHSGKNREN